MQEHITPTPSEPTVAHTSGDIAAPLGGEETKSSAFEMETFDVIEGGKSSVPRKPSLQQQTPMSAEAIAAWQQMIAGRGAQDRCSGILSHPSAKALTGQNVSTKARQIEVLRREVASWFLMSDGKYVSVDNPNTRFDTRELEALLPQKIARQLPQSLLSPKDIGAINRNVMEARPDDPSQVFGIWSGKAYPLPGNISPRLYRNDLWDINTWKQPLYRCEVGAADYGPFAPFLKASIPGELEREVLLDWLAWSLRNEGSKPDWAIFLYSEEKGTGKSTIATVAEALFGAANTAKVEGLSKITGTFADQVLNKKLIIAEEVKLASHSHDGNTLKDLITSDHTTVNIKYKPMQTIDLRACFLLTTNHKPLWLEGGERRYYIIHMSHSGNNQGEGYEAFLPLVKAVKAQIADPQALAGLYRALMERKLSPDFDPRSLNYQKLASPIMRELQADSQPEGDAVLEELLSIYGVQIIPSADQKYLTNFLRLKNEQALRHSLTRLEWEARRVRWGGKQYRVYCPKDAEIENGCIKSEELSTNLERAVEGGYLWWPIERALSLTWQRLMYDKLNPASKPKEGYSALTEADEWNKQPSDSGNEGPFRDNARTKVYWAWKNDWAPEAQDEPGYEL